MAMELIVSGLRIPVENDGPEEYLKFSALKLGLPEASVELVKILFKSLDLSDPQQFYYELSLLIRVPSDYINNNKFPLYIEKSVAVNKPAQSGQRPVIIGFGPAGMFAALKLIEYGLSPLIFERGKKLEERHLDIERFINSRKLEPESNIQFGEGGAGLYSDGKLFARQNNSAHAAKVLDTFIKFGAPPEIGYSAKPHLGTDVLRKITANIRKYILEHGGQIYYSSKMTDMIISGSKVSGVIINGLTEYCCSSLYLATGNSARDTFELLHNKGVSLEARAVSVGVRIEHPVKTIDLIRYGEKYRNFPGLGAATYSFNYTNRSTGRGGYTFCMCPGGEVVNASSEDGLLVLNGMSYSARDSEFSNSAITVTCTPADYGSLQPLAGISFQKEIERKAFIAGGREWKTPAQNLRDFLSCKLSPTLNINSYKMGAYSADIAAIFPNFVIETFRAAFKQWETECPLFVGDDAILMGPETRTSSPVRIKRGPNFESVNIVNLYPIGEGSGYSAGITSSAMDALKAVEAGVK